MKGNPLADFAIEFHITEDCKGRGVQDTRTGTHFSKRCHLEGEKFINGGVVRPYSEMCGCKGNSLIALDHVSVKVAE